MLENNYFVWQYTGKVWLGSGEKRTWLGQDKNDGLGWIKYIIKFTRPEHKSNIHKNNKSFSIEASNMKLGYRRDSLQIQVGRASMFQHSDDAVKPQTINS